MFALMKELKLTAVVQRAEGKDVMLSKDGQVELVPHGDSSPASDEDAALLATVFAKVQELVEEDIESPSAAEKARKLDHLTVADFGEEISGSNHKGGDCEVKSTTGLGFRCKKVVVSISTCLYPMIEFDPPLPQAKKDLSESTTRDAGLSGSFVSDHIGPTTFAFDTCVEQDEQWSISCFVVGKPGLEWSTLPMAVRRKKVLDRLKYAFGKVVGNVPDPINTIEMEWSKNEYFHMRNHGAWSPNFGGAGA
ncbi:hypothetical protein BKA81DRAFT_378530 [Phyllosticta paracitricarpa]